jgi:predicted N-acetyltransferase YhbS
MRLRAARGSERDQVLDLLATWYNDRSFFARYSQNDPRFRDELCLVAVDRGEIVSTVQIFDRKINLAGQTVPMGGIGSVFTREDYRHRGIGSALMRLAVRTLARKEFEVSLLFADRLTFYHQFGWKDVNRSFSVLANPSDLDAPTDYEIAVFDPARDLEAVMRLHRDYSSRFNVTPVRDEADWRANLVYAGNMPNGGCDEYFVLARASDAIRAYARATRFHGIAMVMEYGYRAGATDAMLALFRHLGETAMGVPSSYHLSDDHHNAALLRADATSRAPASVLVTHSRHDEPLENCLSAAGCPPMHHTDRNYMWRVIMPERLGKRFGMEPEAASGYAFSLFEDPHSVYWTSDRF